MNSITKFNVSQVGFTSRKAPFTPATRTIKPTVKAINPTGVTPFQKILYGALIFAAFVAPFIGMD